MKEQELYKLLQEEGYPEFMMDSTVEKLKNLQPEVAHEFSQWIDSKKTPEIEIQGFSYKSLVEDFGMKPVGAFLTLNWLVVDPVEAKESLEEGIL